MDTEDFKKILEKKEIERRNLESFLKSRGLRAETLREIMSPHSEAFDFELGKMSLLLDRAREKADKGDIKLACYMLGAGARVQKDVVYGVMLRVFGLNFTESSYGTALRDYVMNRYQREEDDCIKIASEKVKEVINEK